MKSIYRYFSKTIAAGAVERVSVYASFITMLTNSVAGTNVKISFNGQPFEELPAGLSVALPPEDQFQYLEFQNPSVGAMVITFSLSFGQISDNRINIPGLLSVKMVSNGISTPAKINVGTAAPGAATIAANAARVELVIQNDGANPVWWGDANVDGVNLRGIRIDPGVQVILTTTADVYLRAVGAASDVSYAELTA